MDQQLKIAISPEHILDKMILIAKGVRTSTSEYHTKDIVVLRFEEDQYVFGQGESVLQLSFSPHQYCMEYQICEFSTRFHA